jgi:hypothetical protein
MSREDHFDKLAPDITNHSKNGVSGMKTMTSMVTGHVDDVLVDSGCRAKLHEVRFYLHLHLKFDTSIVKEIYLFAQKLFYQEIGKLNNFM